MTPRAVRRLVLVVFVGGIGGMILGSILDNNGVAITFGLVTAAAALGLILVTMVVPAEAFQRPGGDRFPGRRRHRGAAVLADGVDDEQAGALVEEQVERLTAAGADEREVRELVRRVMTYARRRPDRLTGPGRASRSVRDDAEVDERGQHDGRLLERRRRRPGVSTQLGLVGRLVGVVDAGEARDLAGPGLGVEALRVALLALLDRRVDEDLDEREAGRRRAPAGPARGRPGTG